MEWIGSTAFLAANGQHPQKRWNLSPYAFDQAIEAARLVLDHARPEGVVVPPEPVTEAERRNKFWELSMRKYLDFPPLDGLRNALNGEPAPAEFMQIAALLGLDIEAALQIPAKPNAADQTPQDDAA